MAKKRVRVKKKSTKKSRLVRATSRKIKIASNNFLLFAVLLIISLVSSSFVGELYENLFILFSILFGFISLAFLMVLIILWVMKLLDK